MKLIQDNPSFGIEGKKIEIEIDENIFLKELKCYFNWKKNITFGRFNSLSSSRHDKFIEYLYFKEKVKKMFQK